MFAATGVLMRRYHLEQLGTDSGLRLLFRRRHARGRRRRASSRDETPSRGAVTEVTAMHYLLYYETSPDYPEGRPRYRDEYLRLAWAAHGRGELLLGGALADPVDGAVLLFQGNSSKAAEEFAAADPYVRCGLVTRWYLRPWSTVVGAAAAAPDRPGT